MSTENKKDNIVIEITTGTVVRIILLVVLVIFLYLVRRILAIILFSVVIASAIEPLALWATRRHIPRVLMVLAVYLAAFGLLGVIFYLFIPILFSEFLNFVPGLPSQLMQKTNIQTLFGLAPNLPEALSGILTQLFVGLQGSIEKFATGFFSATAAIFGGALSLILIVIISFYLSVQEQGIEKFLRIITSQKYEEYVLDLWQRSRRKIGLWLQGQILLGVLVAVLVYLGLTILGVKYALILAMFAFVLELIPIFGPIIAAIPAIGVAFLQSPSLALAVTALYIIVQQFESHLIHPVVVRKITGVPSILVIIAMLIGGTLGGIWGILLAIPISAVLVEFLNDLAAKKLEK